MAAPSVPTAGNVTVPDALPVLPLREAVVFPLTALPLAVGQPRSVRLIDDVMRGNRLLALIAQRDAKTEPTNRRWPGGATRRPGLQTRQARRT